MEFIKIAYCVTIPIILLIIWTAGPVWKRLAINLLAISNILLIGNAFFLIRQLRGIYELSKQFSMNDDHLFDKWDGFMIRIAMLVILPFFSLNSYFRNSQLFTLVLLVLVYWTFPVYSWNTYDLLFKIPGYLCLLCAAYAIGWLLNKLPYQSAVT